jgi:uncharacterized protein YkwD
MVGMALLAVAAVVLASVPASTSAWADALVRGVDAGRREAGVSALVRDPALDEIARRRAARMAALPDGRRFALDPPLDGELDDAGLVDYKRAAEHLATLGGYEDVGSAALEQWRDYGPGWREAMEPSWSRVGAAIQRARDGTYCVAAILVAAARPLPTRDALERAVFDAVNVRRAEGGLAPLAWSEQLADVARAHSADMVRRGFFDHRTPSGVTAERRVAAAAIVYESLAENIAKNRRTDDPAATAVHGWMASRPHRAAILGTDYLETGVGVAVARDGTVFVTQLFMRPRISRP